mmetsp:Transcript_24837/g.71706  ORF Transcript_24837/g.71706 Transcript_24837/m.71706 type:complete len:138 (-) Transcript_24837:600-1013(-)
MERAVSLTICVCVVCEQYSAENGRLRNELTRMSQEYRTELSKLKSGLEAVESDKDRQLDERQANLDQRRRPQIRPAFERYSPPRHTEVSMPSRHTRRAPQTHTSAPSSRPGIQTMLGEIRPELRFRENGGRNMPIRG